MTGAPAGASDPAEVTVFLRTHRASNAAARALEHDEPWTATKRTGRRPRRRTQTVTFPFPDDLRNVDEAKTWRRLAEDLAAEHAADAASWTVFGGSLVGAGVGALAGTLASGPGWGQLGWPILVFLGLMALFIFDRSTREAFATTPVWQRRALEYGRRLAELEQRSGRATSPRRHT